MHENLMLQEVYGLAVGWRTRLLLLAVVHEATREGIFRRDAGHLAHKTGLGIRDVEKILSWLDAALAIVPVANSNSEGFYRADLKRLPKRAPFRGERSCQ